MLLTCVVRDQSLVPLSHFLRVRTYCVSQYFHYGVIVIASAYLLVFTLGRMNTLRMYVHMYMFHYKA